MSTFLKKKFCNHDWEKLTEFTINSEMDNLVEIGFRPQAFHSAVRKHVTDYTCKKCGKFFRKTKKTSKI